MQKFKLKLFYILISSGIYFFLTNLSISGVDNYQNAYEVSTSLDSFLPFSLKQGYPSITLWLYYLISNFLLLNYEISHYILATIYIYNIFVVLKLCEINISKINTLIYKLSFLLFFIFGQFGITLILSAEKMLLGMIFLTFAAKSAVNKNNNGKSIFYLLSIATHPTLLVTILLLEFNNLFLILSKFYKKILKLKIPVNYLIPIFFTATIPFIGILKIIEKSQRLLGNRGLLISYSNNSYFLILTGVIIIYFVITKINLKNLFISAFSMLPIYFKIPLGRIGWLFSFAVFYYPLLIDNRIRNANIYCFYIMVLTLFYLYKSFIILENGCFGSC